MYMYIMYMSIITKASGYVVLIFRTLWLNTALSDFVLYNVLGVFVCVFFPIFFVIFDITPKQFSFRLLSDRHGIVL